MRVGNGNWGGYRPGAGRPRGSVFDGGPSPKVLREAMIAGATNSKWAKDPEHPERPGTLENFFRNVAEENIGVFCSLFARLIPRHTMCRTTRPSISFIAPLTRSDTRWKTLAGRRSRSKQYKQCCPPPTTSRSKQTRRA